MADVFIAIRNELLILAIVGLTLGGIDDLLLDMLWIGKWVTQIVAPASRKAAHSLAALPPPQRTGRMAIFIPAWDEAAVIRDTITQALARWEGDSFTLFIGCYRNDPETQAVVRHIPDPRLRLILCPLPGPTTKADCLNSLYRAIAREERRTRKRYKAVVLHDAEDLVHADELKLHDRLIEHFALVQIPVLPLQSKDSIWISGHYVDEFAQAHCRDIVVRGWLRAGLPLAGVGCAIHRTALTALAAKNAGRPFDEQSLTEDYELGLRLAALGFPATFARFTEENGIDTIATRAHFPDTLTGAIRQKTRWTIGIALAGWDRLGWHQGWAANWMLLRDRRAPCAALVLCAGYLALLLTVLLTIAGTAAPLTSALAEPHAAWVFGFTGLCMCWRIGIRMICVWRHYGWQMALIAGPRTAVSNLIFIPAVLRALISYVHILRTGKVRWDKTRHRSPLSN